MLSAALKRLHVMSGVNYLQRLNDEEKEHELTVPQRILRSLLTFIIDTVPHSGFLPFPIILSHGLLFYTALIALFIYFYYISYQEAIHQTFLSPRHPLVQLLIIVN